MRYLTVYSSELDARERPARTGTTTLPPGFYHPSEWSTGRAFSSTRLGAQTARPLLRSRTRRMTETWASRSASFPTGVTEASTASPADFWSPWCSPSRSRLSLTRCAFATGGAPRLVHRSPLLNRASAIDLEWRNGVKNRPNAGSISSRTGLPRPWSAWGIGGEYRKEKTVHYDIQ